MLQRIVAYFGGADTLRSKTIALWGLAFKADTDDIRESPAIRLARELMAHGAHVQAYDPEAIANTKRQLGEMPLITYMDDELAALQHADALVIATEWSQFSAVPLAKVKKLLHKPVIFDGRNMLNIEAVRAAGFYYESIGRAVVKG